MIFAAKAADGADIKVMTSGAFTAAYLELKPRFERATHDRILTLTTTMGIGADSIPNRLERGEPVDVVIVDDASLDQLIQAGRVVASSKVPLARSSIGMAVRAGAHKPDISSTDALKRTLLEAKSIAYSASVSGTYLSTELFQRLGIAEQIASKSKRIERERVGAVVARGEAEIGFQQVSELLPIRGIDYVGPLPSEVQRVSLFSAGVVRGAGNPDAAGAFIKFLASPQAAAAIAKSGMEPIATTSTPPAAFHLLEATIDDVHAALYSGRTTCRELVELYLKRVATYDKAGPALNAVQTVNPRALQDAERLDAAFHASGPTGGLHCIPVLVKDQLEAAGMPTTYGSAVFQDFVSERDATAVARLRKAGAVIIGKATMGEFASGILGSASGPIRNPYDPRRHASGSSGGTGSGVAANFATAGIGEDTGGSVRGPAAVSNLVGLRPTTPLVSRYGMFPARPTTDTVGPIARTVKDAAILLDAIGGYDPNDPVTAYAVEHIPSSYTSALTRDGLKGARIGVIHQAMDANTDTTSEDYRKVKAVIETATEELKMLGAEVVEPVTIPDVIDRLNKAYDGNLFETEPAINDYLAKLANPPVRTLRDILLSGKVVPSRARSLISNVGRSTDDAGYAQVQRMAESTRQVVLALMADHKLNALVYATFDHQPIVIPPDAMTKPGADDGRLGNNRRLSPILGFPAITVPAGFTTDGIPVGLEFMARPFAESMLFRFAYAYEQGTHHRRAPASTPALRGEP
jgi:Asp-tRNA(Asn)/Glu-tRNA(Gln) amidotransferase A subunit family amidase/ABC-type molybdate transport system substrate-binding protein